MGIKDLLRFMKPYILPIHIKKYAGKRVGIDAYSWLHKGAYSCSLELYLDSNGGKKFKYIDYFMQRINLLRCYNITPVVVFDGGDIPCKAATEQERHRRREMNLEAAVAKLNDGDVNGATELFQRSIRVTPAMVDPLIRILKSENIEFLVAPYEADAQLAYLASLEEYEGGIVAVITEDSDLLAYGCKAIVFKMDRNGSGEELVVDNIFNPNTRKPSFQNFDKELFTGMCVLAGCDFLPSVPGIGIVRAHAFVSKYLDLNRVLSVLKLVKGGKVPEEYSKSFRKTLAVFRHARVYDPITKTLKHMNPVPQELLHSLEGNLDFLGPHLPPSVAFDIAQGKIDPISMEAFNRRASEPNSTNQIQTSRRLYNPRTALLPEQAVCVTTCESRIRSKPQLKEIKHSEDDTKLHLLVTDTRLTKPYVHVRDLDVVKFPDNNPFKRRKASEIPTKNSEEMSSILFRCKTRTVDEESSGVDNMREHVISVPPTFHVCNDRL